MKKILLTGGAGFIGNELVNQLYNLGEYYITVIDCTEQIHGYNWKESYLYNNIKDKCNFIYGDIRDFDIVEKAVADNEYIIHLAADTGTGQSMYRINQYNDVNIMGTSNLLLVISSKGAKNNVKKIILSSSRSVYGEGKYKCPNCGVVCPKSRNKENMIKKDFNLYCDKCGEKLKVLRTTEDSDVTPGSLYAYTKFAQEKMLQTMCPALGIDYTIFRCQNVYGVGQSLKNPYTGILSIFSTLLLENKPINVFENGLESRDFINVRDVAKGVILSIQNNKSNSEIINLGSGIGTSVIDIANMLKKIYKSKSVINITGDFRIGDIAHNVADIQKAKEILGFNPNIDLKNGLIEFCKWVMDEDKDNGGYEKSLIEMENEGMFIRGNN